jgi:hypothetical protein
LEQQLNTTINNNNRKIKIEIPEAVFCPAEMDTRRHLRKHLWTFEADKKAMFVLTSEANTKENNLPEN